MFQQCSKSNHKIFSLQESRLILIDLNIKKCGHVLNDGWFLHEENNVVLQQQKFSDKKYAQK